MKHQDGCVYGLMTLTALFWAGAFIGGKIAVKELPPVSLTFFRFLFATAILFPVMIWVEPKAWKLHRSDIPIVLILGMTGMFGYHVLFFLALQHTSAMNTSLISAASPVLTTVLAAAVVGESLGLKRIAAVAAAFLGVVLTISEGNLDIIGSIALKTGDLFMVAACLCKAAYIVFSRKFSRNYSPVVLTTYSFLVCVVASAPFLFEEGFPGYLPAISWQGWASVAYMSIFASCIGYLAQQYAIKTIGASRTTTFENLVPVFAIVLSNVILYEKITMIKVLSAVIIIAGVYWNSTLGPTGKSAAGKPAVGAFR